MTLNNLGYPRREANVEANRSGRRGLVPLAERCFALAIRIVPQRLRFDAALFVARVTLPLFRGTEAYREQHIKQFISAREIVLYLLLNALTKHGTPFDVEIKVNGYEHFLKAYAKQKGALVIGHHAALTLFMVRHFHDKGLNPIVISPDPNLRAAGTLVNVQTLLPSPMFLVQLRSRLRNAELICAMPDRAEHQGDRTIEFETSRARVIIAPAIIEVAARCGAEVLFTEVRLEGRHLTAIIDTPKSSSTGVGPAITEDFISFVRERLAFSLQSDEPHIAKFGDRKSISHSHVQ